MTLPTAEEVLMGLSLSERDECWLEDDETLVVLAIRSLSLASRLAEDPRFERREVTGFDPGLPLDWVEFVTRVRPVPDDR